MIMKKFINRPEDVAKELTQGLVKALNPDLGWCYLYELILVNLG